MGFDQILYKFFSDNNNYNLRSILQRDEYPFELNYFEAQNRLRSNSLNMIPCDFVFKKVNTLYTIDLQLK